MRPPASTAVASIMTSPAPPTARLPRWTRCQSLANPSSHEYWHIGETAMRLRKTISRMASGVKRLGASIYFFVARERASDAEVWHPAGAENGRDPGHRVRLRPAIAPTILRPGYWAARV